MAKTLRTRIRDGWNTITRRLTSGEVDDNFLELEDAISNSNSNVSVITNRIVTDYDKAFIIGGQSNADGSAAIPSTIEYPHPRVLLYTKNEEIELCSEPAGRTGDNWIDNRPAGNTTTPGDRFSFTTSLGKSIVNITGINPIMVPCAIGSTSMQNWVPPATEDDMTTLFGAMTARTKTVANLRTLNSIENPPVFVWFGHEANSGEVTENLTTGVIGKEYVNRWISHTGNINSRFSNSVILYAQLSTHNDAPLAANLRRAAESQRLAETEYGDNVTILSYVNSNVAIDFSSGGSAGTDANNTATANVTTGELSLVWNGANILEGWIDTLTPNTYYKINVTATGSQWRFFTDTSQIGSTRSAGNVTIEFKSGTWAGDTSKARARFVEPSGTSPGNVVIKINSLEKAVHPMVENNYMVVTHDLPRNASPDGYHINAVGLKEVGRRFALCYAERVLGMHWINGTGPRLSSITKPSNTTVKVTFNKNIVADSNGYGTDVGNSLFRVYQSGVETALISALRDPSDSKAVLLTTANVHSGNVVITYGDRPGPSNATLRQGVVYDEDGLPAPQFGPVLAV